MYVNPEGSWASGSDFLGLKFRFFVWAPLAIFLTLLTAFLFVLCNAKNQKQESNWYYCSLFLNCT